MKRLNSCKKSANTTKKEQSQTIKTELSKELGKLEEQVKNFCKKLYKKTMIENRREKNYTFLGISQESQKKNKKIEEFIQKKYEKLTRLKDESF